MNFTTRRTSKSALANAFSSPGSARDSRAGDGALAIANFFLKIDNLLMSAGSSPDTGKNSKDVVIAITEPPVVEIDTEATAAYISLRDGKVARTEQHESEKGLVMLDFDEKDNVIGIEVVGQQEFSIRELIKQVPVEATDAVLNQTRYVAADLAPA